MNLQNVNGIHYNKWWIKKKNSDLQERKKITKLIKDGQSKEIALKSIDQRFLSIEETSEQIEKIKYFTKNSISGKLFIAIKSHCFCTFQFYTSIM